MYRSLVRSWPKKRSGLRRGDSMSRHTVPSSLDCARKHAASIRLLVGDIRDDLGEALQHGEHASVVLVDDLTDDLAASAAELQRHATLAASVAEELRRATTLGAA